MAPYKGYEQGPIRPPSEASSLLLRVNRNCPWNRCTFCSVYNREKFSLRPVEDIIRDIDTIHRYIGMLDSGDPPGSHRLDVTPDDEQGLFAARNWRAAGMESIFLQDADSLTIRSENLLAILRHLKARFPQVKRITSYARSESIARISDQALKELAAAGLNRIHVGMETASDNLLAMVQKGVDKQTHIEAGLKVKNAGIELSEYFLIGLGGTEFSEEHALESADAVNRINPDFIRFRTLHLLDRVNLFAGSARHQYRWAPDQILAREVHTFIWHLEGITSAIKSDHSYNLFQEIDGIMPHDKGSSLNVLSRFMAMGPEEQVLFRVGKRTGHFLRLDDMKMPGRMEQVRAICRQSGITPQNADEQIHELLQERMKRGTYW